MCACVCVVCTGSNGQEYQFLLKGHEDLRQDERVMQLFGLVNSLLLNHPETFRRNLTSVPPDEQNIQIIRVRVKTKK